MKVILSNAFSFQMTSLDDGILKFKKVSPEDLRNTEFISVIGNEELASVLTDEIGKEVKMNRCSIELSEGDTLYVAAIIGGKLPAGCKKLPAGCRLSIKKIVLI